MAGIGSIVLDKLEQLADVVRPNVSLLRPRPPESPTAVLEAVTLFSTRVNDSLPGLSGAEPPLSTALIADLFAFLSDMPSLAPHHLHLCDGFPPEPSRAWLEPRSDFFWTFAALIQDVWEHIFSSEADCDPHIVRSLKELTPHRVLDFGSGVGYFAFHLARAGAQVTCLEPNPLKRRFLAFRRSRWAEGKRIHLSERGQHYDLVIAINVLDHVRSPARALQKLALLTAPGGSLACVAAFPEDGWHSGSASTRELVYRELMRYFQYPDSGRQGDRGLIVLTRHMNDTANRKRKFLQLHPSAILAPDLTDRQRFILSASRFYVQPLAITSDAVPLVDLCRKRQSRSEIIRQARNMGLDGGEVRRAIDTMEASNLLVRV
jgi:SAM-dependent methyltransferase